MRYPKYNALKLLNGKHLELDAVFFEERQAE